MSGLKYSDVKRFLESELAWYSKMSKQYSDQMGELTAASAEYEHISEMKLCNDLNKITVKGIIARFEIMFGEYNDEEYANE